MSSLGLITKWIRPRPIREGDLISDELDVDELADLITDCRYYKSAKTKCWTLELHLVEGNKFYLRYNNTAKKHLEAYLAPLLDRMTSNLRP